MNNLHFYANSRGRRKKKRKEKKTHLEVSKPKIYLKEKRNSFFNALKSCHGPEIRSTQNCIPKGPHPPLPAVQICQRSHIMPKGSRDVSDNSACFLRCPKCRLSYLCRHRFIQLPLPKTIMNNNEERYTCPSVSSIIIRNGTLVIEYHE